MLGCYAFLVALHAKQNVMHFWYSMPSGAQFFFAFVNIQEVFNLGMDSLKGMELE